MSDPVPCRERIVAAVKSVMESVTGLPVERNRKTPVQGADEGQESELPLNILFEGDEADDTILTGEDGYLLPLLAQVAIDGSGEDAATKCNGWRAQLRRKLMADRTLGGLARDLVVTEPGDWIGVEVVGADIEGFMLAMEVRYATVEGDPYTFSNGG